jgi:NAD(P)-dependent dehydrogenase (short-subunit alcohol dehydrogenase family)
MVPRRRGTIVTVSSNAAGVPRSGMAAYAASKAAATMFTKCLGLELARTGVRCNVVSPGSTDTPMLRGMLPDEGAFQRTIDGLPAQYKLGIPLKKIATAREIANTVLFLASDLAGYITGHDLAVDGGTNASNGYYQIPPIHHVWNADTAPRVGGGYDGLVPRPEQFEALAAGIPGVHYPPPET